MSAISLAACQPLTYADLTCGAGTTQRGSTCVPASNGDAGSTLSCGTGTVQVGSQCVPWGGDPGSPLTCGEGTIQVGNECVAIGNGGDPSGGDGDDPPAGDSDAPPGDWDTSGCNDVTPAQSGDDPSSAPSAATNFAIDAAHTNAQPFDTVASPLQPLWSHKFNGPVDYALVVNGLVVVAAAESQPNVRALDLESGNLVWGPFVLGSTAHLAADAARIYALDRSGNLIGLEAATGHRIWSTKLVYQSYYWSPPSAAYGYVFVNGLGWGGTTYCIDGSTGETVWAAGTFDGSQGTVAVAGGVVYESEACDQLSAFDVRTGALRWFYSTSCTGGGGAAPSVYGCLIWERDWALGNIIIDATGAPFSSFAGNAMPAFDAGMVFYQNLGTVTAVDIATSTIIWSTTPDADVCTAPVVAGGGGQVFVGSTTGSLYELSEKDGTQLSVVTLDTPATCASENSGMSIAGNHLLVPAGNQLIVF